MSDDKEIEQLSTTESGVPTGASYVPEEEEYIGDEPDHERLSFEHEFPSLAGKQYTGTPQEICEAMERDVRKHTTDNQRIREALKDLVKEHFSVENGPDFPTLTAEHIDQFEKRLNL